MSFRSRLVQAAAMLGAAAALTAAPLTASASVIWTLNNFKFSDGATATGTFTWEEATNKVTDWHIDTTAGAFGAHTYANGAPGNGVYTVAQNQYLLFQSNGWDLRVALANFDLLDSPAAHLALQSTRPAMTGQDGYIECRNCAPVRYGQAGAFLSAAVANVPEPSTIALSGLALAMLAFVHRRRNGA